MQQIIQLIKDVAGQGGGNFIAGNKNSAASCVYGDVGDLGNFFQIVISFTEKLAGEIIVGEVETGLFVCEVSPSYCIYNRDLRSEVFLKRFRLIRFKVQGSKVPG